MRTAPAAFSGGGEQGGRPRVRRLRRPAHDRLLLRHPRHQAGRAPLPAQPHAGRAARVSQRADRPPPQTPPARRCPGARHRPDRVDLRSAGTQERLPQYRKAGRHRAASTRKTSTAPPPAPCTADCPPTAAPPNGGSIRRASTRFSAATGAADRPGGLSDAHRLSHRYRASSASRTPPARAKSNRPTPAFSSTPSRAGSPSPALSAPRPKAPTFWNHGNETRPHHPAPDPHAAGALLRNQLFPHLQPRHHSGGSHRRRRHRLGRSHRRREPLLQRGVDRLRLAASCTITSRRACSARR